MPSTKRKSTYDTHDSFVASDNSDTAPNPKSKRSKPTSSKPNSTTFTSASSLHKPAQKQTDGDGNDFWAISTARRVTISDFKGKKMVSVREYYEKDGTWLPGKKGITMTLEQYSELVKVLPQIERALGKEGERVGRPDYGDEGVDGGGEDGDEDVHDGDDEDGEADRKANIEATSDEDEG